MRALVLGLGATGLGIARWLVREGWSVRVADTRTEPPQLDVLRTELPHVEFVGGPFATTLLEGIELVAISPGLSPLHAPARAVLEAARARKVEVVGEIELFARALAQLRATRQYAPRVVGITGTNGKTTTTALTAEVLQAGGLRVMRGGNIGEPVLDRIDQLQPDDWVVLELSSFQLESITKPRLHIGLVLNVTPDHLDRHKSFAHYVEIKARAVAFMQPEDHAVLNIDDPACAAMQERTKGDVIAFGLHNPVRRGVTLVDGWITIAHAGVKRRVLPAADVPIPGEHNLSNVMAAVGAGDAAGIDPEHIAGAVRDFKAVEHRLEPIATFNGVRWYNDSKATNPDSTYKALAAFSEPIVLIAGGRNKGIEIEPLAQAIARRVVALVAMGETGEELARRTREAGLARVERATDLKDAVRKAAALAPPGSVVLLSPAFTSYDMFRDYEDRGRRFKATVLEQLQ